MRLNIRTRKKANRSAEGAKPIDRQGLCEKISKLLYCWDVTDVYSSTLLMFSDEMINYINMLSAVMELWIMNQPDSTLVVKEQRCR